MSKGLKRDFIIGEAAALENVISHCDADMGKFRRDDLTDRQNAAIWDALERVKTQFNARRAVLLAKL